MGVFSRKVIRHYSCYKKISLDALYVIDYTGDNDELKSSELIQTVQARDDDVLE